jgi:hypothetical protein
MSKFDSINDWLASSIKNRYYFSKDSILEDKKYLTEFDDVYYTLFLELANIKSRETYIAWRAVWRGLYAKISDESRFAKSNRKSTIVGHEISERNVSIVYHLGELATKMLIVRQHSKEISAAQYTPKVKEEA